VAARGTTIKTTPAYRTGTTTTRTTGTTISASGVSYRFHEIIGPESGWLTFWQRKTIQASLPNGGRAPHMESECQSSLPDTIGQISKSPVSCEKPETGQSLICPSRKKDAIRGWWSGWKSTNNQENKTGVGARGWVDLHPQKWTPS